MASEKNWSLQREISVDLSVDLSVAILWLGLRERSSMFNKCMRPQDSSTLRRRNSKRDELLSCDYTKPHDAMWHTWFIVLIPRVSSGMSGISPWLVVLKIQRSGWRIAQIVDAGSRVDAFW